MAVLADYALTTLSDVKESMGIASSDTSWDNLIIRKINQATDMIEAYCGFDSSHHFKRATYTDEEYTGTGTNQLFLKARPIVSITSFSQRDTIENDNDWTTIDTENYFINESAGLVDGIFGLGSHNSGYKITYVAGYETIPYDLAEACVTLASYLADNSQTGTSVASKTEGRRSVSYFQPQQGESVLKQLSIDDVLDRYATPALAGW